MTEQDDSSIVEVLAEAASGLSKAEVYRLIKLLEQRYPGDRPDPVGKIVDAIAGLQVDDMANLQRRLRVILRAAPPATPPPQDDGGAGSGVPRTPKPPRLSDGAMESLA